MITKIKNIAATKERAAPRVKAGTEDAAACAAKAKPQIIAASKSKSGEVIFFRIEDRPYFCVLYYFNISSNKCQPCTRRYYRRYFHCFAALTIPCQPVYKQTFFRNYCICVKR